MAQTTAEGRIARAALYIEPDLYTLMQREAEASGDTISNWMRKLVMADLMGKNRISQDLLLKLASGPR